MFPVRAYRTDRADCVRESLRLIVTPRRDTMRQRNKQAPQSAEEIVRDIRRATRRQFSAEEKIRIVLEGLRGEDSIAELCRKEGIAQKPLLPMVQGVPRSRQEAARWRHGP